MGHWYGYSFRYRHCFWCRCLRGQSMIVLTPMHCYFLYRNAMEMRKSFDGPCSLARTV